MTSPFEYSPASSGSVVLTGTPAYASVTLSSASTANYAVTNAYNWAVAPPSFTFMTTLDQYTKIFSGQCNRMHSYIYGQLESIDRSDDDQNETIIDNIADIIDLVGEPASFTAMFEAGFLKDDPSALEPLLLAIGTARQKETEDYRAETLRRFAQDSDYRVRRAAVRALGRMKSQAAKRALHDISNRPEAGEIAGLAAAMLR